MKHGRWQMHLAEKAPAPTVATDLAAGSKKPGPKTRGLRGLQGHRGGSVRQWFCKELSSSCFVSVVSVVSVEQ